MDQVELSLGKFTTPGCGQVHSGDSSMLIELDGEESAAPLIKK
jgi:hypothetical protein